MNLLAQDFDGIQSAAGITTPPANFGEIITKTLPYIFGAAGIILLFNIISSGFKMMTSVGDPKVMQSAQGKISTSLVGIVILSASFWAVQLLMKFLGFNTILFN